jgi:translocation and assembly module TamB
MRSQWKKRLPVFIFLMLVLYLFLWKAVLPTGLDKVRPFVEQTAETYLNGELHIGKIEASPDLCFTVRDGLLRDKNGQEVARIPALSISVNPLNLLRGSGALGMVTTITVKEPVISLVMDGQDRWNVENLLKKTESGNEDFKGKVLISDGTANIMTPYGQWQLGVDGTVDLARNPVYGLNFFLRNGKSVLSVSGAITGEGKGHMTAASDEVQVTEFAALAAHYLPISGLAGTVKEISISWDNNDEGSQLSGHASPEGLSLTYTYGGKDYPVTADGRIGFDNLDLAADRLSVTVCGQPAVVTGGLDLSDTDRPEARNLKIRLSSFDPSALPLDLPVSGAISGTILLNGNQDQLTADGTLTADALEAAGYSLSRVSVPFGASGHTAEINRASADFGGGRAFLSASYDWQSREVVVSAQADHVDLGTAVPRLGSLIADGTVYAAGSYQDGVLQMHSLSDELSLSWNGLTLQDIAFDAALQPEGITVTRLSAYTPQNGIVTGSGSVRNGALEGDFYVTDIPVQPFFRYLGQSGEGLLSAHVLLEGTTDNPQGSAAFSIRDGQYMGFIAQEAHGLAAWKDHVARFVNVEINPPKGRHHIDGTVNLTTSDPVLDLTLETTGVRMEPYSEALHSPLPVTGNLTNTVHLTGPLSNPKVSGHIRAYDGSVNKFLFDELSGDYTLQDGLLTLKNFQFHALTSTATFAGTIDRSGKMNIGIDAYHISLQRLPWLKDYVSLAGAVNFNGAVSGWISRPQFTGVLTSDSVIINGEEFTGLALSITSDNGKVNELEGSFQQKSGGDYFLTARFDFAQRLFQWKAEVERGNVRSLLKMGGIQADIDGYLSGTIVLNSEGRGTGMTIQGKVEDGKVSGVPFASADFDVFTKYGYWQIRKLEARESSGGFFAAKGEFDVRKRTLNLEAAANGITPKILTVAMDDPIEIGGSLNFAAQVKGSMDDPNGNFSLEVNSGSISGVRFDSLYGMATLRNGMFSLDQLLVQRDIYKLSAYGTVPLDLLRPRDKRKNPDARMNLEIRLDNANLDILPTMTKYVQWASGPLSGKVTVTGTLENYNLNGSVDLDGGTVKVRGMNNTFDNIKFHALFEGNQVNLKEFSTTVGDKGLITASGNYRLHGGDKPYQMNLAIRNVVIDSNLLGGKINGDIAVTQKDAMPFVSGNVNLEDLYVGLTSVPDFGSGGSPIGMDLTIDLGEKIHLHTASFYDIWGNGKMHITGTTAYPVIDGAINLMKGTLNYLNTTFRLGRSIVTWPRPGTFVPLLDMKAMTHLGQYTIFAKAQGPLSLDELQIKLSSDPPRDENTLKRFLTLKTDSTDMSNNDWMTLVDAGIQLSYLSDVEDAIKQALNLDELRVYSGSLQNGIGFSVDVNRANQVIGEDRRQYNWLISRSFGGKLRLGYTASFDGEDTSIFAEYNLLRKVNLSISMDEEQNKWYGIQYHTRF